MMSVDRILGLNGASTKGQTMIVSWRNLHNIGTAAQNGQPLLHRLLRVLRCGAHTMLRPASPRMIRLTSRVVQPAASGVPVPGARPGSVRRMTILVTHCRGNIAGTTLTYDINIETIKLSVSTAQIIIAVYGFQRDAPQINGRVPDTFTDTFDNVRHAIVVNVICSNHLEANIFVVIQVGDALFPSA